MLLDAVILLYYIVYFYGYIVVWKLICEGLLYHIPQLVRHGHMECTRLLLLLLYCVMFVVKLLLQLSGAQ